MILLATEWNINFSFDMNRERVETRTRDRNTLVDPKPASFGIPPLSFARTIIIAMSNTSTWCYGMEC